MYKSTQFAPKFTCLRSKIEKFFWGGGTAPSPDPRSLILGVFPLHQIAHVGSSEHMGAKLFGPEIIFKVFKPI